MPPGLPETARYPAVRLLLSPTRACSRKRLALVDPLDRTGHDVSHTALRIRPLNVTLNRSYLASDAKNPCGAGVLRWLGLVVLTTWG